MSERVLRIFFSLFLFSNNHFDKPDVAARKENEDKLWSNSAFGLAAYFSGKRGHSSFNKQKILLSTKDKSKSWF